MRKSAKRKKNNVGGRVRTRAQKRNAIKSYARRRALSNCRGKKIRACKYTLGCKVAKGKKRTFCRKSKSVRRKR